MRKVVIVLIAVILFSMPVCAMEFTAPTAPESAEQYMPENTESFWDGVLSIIRDAVKLLKPSVAEAAKICASLIVTVLLVTLLSGSKGVSTSVVDLVSTITIGVLLLQSSASMINLGIQTVQEISEYGKMLLPVMTAALAANGGTTSSAALYIGTTIFNTVLSALSLKLIVPTIYIFIALCVVGRAIKQEIVNKFIAFIKWLITWVLKIVLYTFMGYIGLTGVITGTVDASALKATKLAISGLVPVVGNVISDASETILLSAGLMKNAAGIYGLLVIIAICAGPFIQIGVQYLMLKATGGICSIYGNKDATELIQDFSAAMGFLLAMTGVMSLIFMVSTVCFMKGLVYG